ncbi:MAG: hypothetical protein ACRD0U_09655, partial [Acidimicrobiales bacterium]
LGVEAMAADDFVLGHVEQHPGDVLAAIDAMAARRLRRPKTRGDLIGSLGRYLPGAMAALHDPQ